MKIIQISDIRIIYNGMEVDIKKVGGQDLIEISELP